MRRRPASAAVGSLTLFILHWIAEDEVRPLRHPFGMSNEPPFLRGSVSLTQNRRPDSSPRRGFTVAGQCRDLTGLRWNLCHSGFTGASATLADRAYPRWLDGSPLGSGPHPPGKHGFHVGAMLLGDHTTARAS